MEQLQPLRLVGNRRRILEADDDPDLALPLGATDVGHAHDLREGVGRAPQLVLPRRDMGDRLLDVSAGSFRALTVELTAEIPDAFALAIMADASGASNQKGTRGYAIGLRSRMARTRRTSASGANGFSRSSIPASNVPDCRKAFSVYPET
jgi:hypothetical protein